jgi:hypothetical protein
LVSDPGAGKAAAAAAVFFDASMQAALAAALITIKKLGLPGTEIMASASKAKNQTRNSDLRGPIW